MDHAALAQRLKAWGAELGFQKIGIAEPDLSAAEPRLLEWLSKGWHGEMEYMARHGALRARPGELRPGTLRVISCRMNYAADVAEGISPDGDRAYIARYARGRDYHKVLRDRLQKLCDRIAAAAGPFGYRAFTDSAPVMEVELAARAGLGWRGKHTLLLSRDAGSWFFLGEIYCDLPLPADVAEDDHCGSCRRCIDVCPTQAIRGPYQLDARRCISYLTIELHGAIPVELRRLLGNRIYGCDDCQLVCPWNKFARAAAHPDFKARHGLDAARLAQLFAWTEAEFLARTEGSAIRRIGYQRWLRNIAVALGNAPSTPANLAALAARRGDPSELVREHVTWALGEHARRAAA